MISMASLKSTSSRPVLSWPLKSRKPTVEDERAIIPTLMKNAHESGRGIELPIARREEIATAAERLGFSVNGAMSYRRQLIRQASRSDGHYWSKSMQMGNVSDVNTYSTMLEKLVGVFLESAGITFKSELELQREGSRNTPDFFIPGGCMINDTLVYWIDCKTFYGSATLACDSKQPVGKLLPAALRYNTQFGEGCFMFLGGFSGDFSHYARLDGKVLLLDATPLDTSELFAFSSPVPSEVVVPVHDLAISRSDKPKKKGSICRFYNTRNGCLKGEACTFYHTASKK